MNIKINSINQNLAWTGERYIPSVRGAIETEHLHRYTLALDLVRNKDVLDIACGEGYGTHLLASVAHSAIGIDLSHDVVQHAQSKYALPNLIFRQGDCTQIPLANNSVDVVVSYETIEHHDKHEKMLSEIKRVLKPGGFLLISTPERDMVESLMPHDNEFHIRELNLYEFSELISQYFKNIAMFGQRVRYGSLLLPVDSNFSVESFSLHTGDISNIVTYKTDPSPMYLIAVASDDHLPQLGIGFFDNCDFLYQERARWQSDNEILLNEVARLKRTFSWQITKPLRYIWNKLIYYFHLDRYN